MTVLRRTETAWEAYDAEGNSLGYYNSEAAANAAISRDIAAAQRALLEQMPSEFRPPQPGESLLQYRLRTGRSDVS